MGTWLHARARASLYPTADAVVAQMEIPFHARRRMAGAVTKHMVATFRVFLKKLRREYDPIRTAVIRESTSVRSSMTTAGRATLEERGVPHMHPPRKWLWIVGGCTIKSWQNSASTTSNQGGALDKVKRECRDATELGHSALKFKVLDSPSSRSDFRDFVTTTRSNSSPAWTAKVNDQCTTLLPYEPKPMTTCEQ